MISNAPLYLLGIPWLVTIGVDSTTTKESGYDAVRRRGDTAKHTLSRREENSITAKFAPRARLDKSEPYSSESHIIAQLEPRTSGGRDRRTLL